MCGILGAVGDVPSTLRSKLKSAKHYIQHRGPDESSTLSSHDVWLTSTRLRVKGGSLGRQPLNENPKLYLAFNGEITNFEQLGFQNYSDTYDLYSLLSQDKLHLLAQMEGHFAFSFWNSSNSELLLARDRFGEKPLYYMDLKHSILFSSSADALSWAANSRDFSASMLASFLRFGYVDSGSNSIFENIFQVPPGHLLRWKKGAGLSLSPFVIPMKYQVSQKFKSVSEVLIEFETIFESTIKRFIEADVELATFLSGGLDSSLIALFASQFKQIRSYSISLPMEPQDALNAERVANHLGIKHHTFEFKPKSLLENLTSYQETFDTPLADPAIFPLMALVRNASKELKGALAGEGGDELFAGYPWSYAKLLYNPKKLMPIREFALRIVRKTLANEEKRGAITHRVVSLQYAQMTPECRRESFLGESEYFTRSEIKKLSLPDTLHGEGIEQFGLRDALELDQQHYLQNNLLIKSDRASMAFGFEMRLPFLAPEIVNFSKSLPESLLISNQESKILLRRLAEKKMPSLTWNTKKTGLGIPLSYLQREMGYIEQLRKMLTNNQLASLNGHADVNEMKKLSLSSPRKAWNMFMLLKWLERRV